MNETFHSRWFSATLLLMTSAMLLTSSGCITPLNTQFPTLYANDPRIEQQRNEQFDPFASTDLGPSTMTRQRDNRIRDFQRRAVDNAMRLPNFRGNRNRFGQPFFAPGYQQPPVNSAPAFTPQPQIQPMPDPTFNGQPQGPTMTPF